jgi:hypothetical protein
MDMDDDTVLLLAQCTVAMLWTVDCEQSHISSLSSISEHTALSRIRTYILYA